VSQAERFLKTPLEECGRFPHLNYIPKKVSPMPATPERRAELLRRVRDGGGLIMSELEELGIHPEDVDENWMDEIMKRLFHEIRKQLSQLEAAQFSSDTAEQAARRAANARSLSSLQKTLERLARLEEKRETVRDMKVINADDNARLELERRLDQCLAARRALLPPPKPETGGNSASS
jgi:hypothetical protein